MADSGNFLTRLSKRGTIKQVAEALTGAKARARFLRVCGYPGQPQGLMQRLHARLKEILPLSTQPGQLALFSRLFAMEKLIEQAKREPLAPPAPDAAWEALMPWFSGQGALRLARAGCLLGGGEFNRPLTRWLDTMLALNRDLIGQSWQDNALMAARALNLLFSLRFMDNPDKLPEDLCADIMLHLHLIGQILEQELNDKQKTPSEPTALSGALLFLGCALNFAPEANDWLALGSRKLGPALLAEAGSAKLRPIAHMRAVLQWGALGLWLGRKQNIMLPELVAGIHKLASQLRLLAPPWFNPGWEDNALPLGLSGQGQEANLAALLLSEPSLRGPRTSSELLFWLLGPEVDEQLRQLTEVKAPGAADLPGVGLSALCTRLNHASLGLWMVTGPRPEQHGSQPFWPLNHALSLFIFRQGRPLLLAPASHGKGSLAEYLKSRRAMNALMVDGAYPGLGQVELEGLEQNSAHLFMAASFNGYRNLPDPVTLRRRVFVDQAAGVMNIVDQVQGAAEHLCTLYFHFPPGARLSPAPKGGFVVEVHEERWWFKSDAKTQISLALGQAEPPLGWSLHDNRMLPSPTLTVQANVVGSARLSCSLALLPAQ